MTSRVDTVVRVRRLQERMAKAEVFDARRALDDRRSEAAFARTFLDELASSTPAAPAAFVAHRGLLDGGARELQRAHLHVDDASGAATAALDGWFAATRRLDGVERLAERQAQRTEAELDRQTRAELDDLTVMRWNREENT